MLGDFRKNRFILEARNDLKDHLEDAFLASFKIDGRDCYIIQDQYEDKMLDTKQYHGYLLLGKFELDKKIYQVITKQKIHPDNIKPNEVLDLDTAISLTERELQIAILVTNGFLNKQIADKLSLSVYTVSTHLRRIFTKCGVHNRTALAAKIKSF